MQASKDVLSSVLSKEELAKVRPVEESVQQIVAEREVLFSAQSKKNLVIHYRSPRGFEVSLNVGRFPLKTEKVIQIAETYNLDEAGHKCVWQKGTLQKGHFSHEDGSQSCGFVSKVQDVEVAGQMSPIAVKKDEMTTEAENTKNVSRTRLEKYLPDTIEGIVVNPSEATFDAKKVWTDLVSNDEMMWFETFIPQTKEAGLRRAVLYPVGTPEKFGFILMTYGGYLEMESLLMVEEGSAIKPKKTAKTARTGSSVQVTLVGE